MGKSSKKANAAVVASAVSTPPSTAPKKGKRNADEAIEKTVNSKKQKKDIEELVSKPKNDTKVKKAVKVPPAKKKPETSSDDTDSSDSEKEVNVPPKQNVKAGNIPIQGSSSDDSSSDEETETKVVATSKKPTAVAKNGTAAVSKKQESSESDSDSSDSDEEPAPAKKPSATEAKNGKVVKAPKKQEPSDSSDSESSSDEEAEVTAAKKPTAPVQQKKAASSDSSDGSDEDEPPTAKSNVSVTKQQATDAKHPRLGKSVAKSDSSEDSSDESDEEPKEKKVKSTGSIVGKANIKAVKKESSDSDEDDSEADDSSDEEPAQTKSLKTTKKSDSDEDEDEDEDSEDEEPMKTPKKDMDVEMTDVPSVNASKSEKKAPKTPASSQSQASGSNTLFVGNLSFNAGQDEIHDFFSQAGEVVAVRLATNDEGRPRGFGHVEFASVEDAQKALELNGQELLGRAVRLDSARERGAYTPSSGNDNKSFQKGGKAQSQTIFVKGFNKNLEEEQIRSSLQEHFGSCGDISRVSIPKDYESGYSKGIAYMDFADKEAFESALELSGSELDGYSLIVEAAKPKDDNRDGGWSGGRGSGGRFGGRDSGGRFGGRRGGGRGGRGDRGGRGRGGRSGTPFKSTGKKTTFGDD